MRSWTLGQPWSSRFSSLSNKLPRILHFSVLFCKLFTLYSCRKNVWKLTVIQTSSLTHNSVKVFCGPKRLFFGFVLFWRTKWVSLNIAINKKFQFLNNHFICQLNIYYNARHTASKVDRVEMEGGKSFT